MKPACFLKCFFTIVLWAILHESGFAQISLSPTALFIRDDTFLGELYISNPSENDLLEVTVYPEFGYPAPGPDGSLMMVSHDTLRAATSCFASQLRIFPRSFLLLPRQLQVVRLQVRPIREKPDQAYFTRIIVSSGLQSRETGMTLDDKEDNARVRYVFRQNIPAFFLKGEVNTGINISHMETDWDNVGLKLWTDLIPTGNAPFLGSLSVSLVDDNQKKAAIHQQSVAIYVEGRFRFDIPMQKDQVSPGQYTLECLFETRRGDISANDLIQAHPVVFRKKMEIGQP